MTLPAPKLDDRRFDAMVLEALELIRARCPQWTELGAGDPGVTLIEVFAFLTENMLYRLNRVPEKLYVSLLNLVGVQARAPAAAVAILTFTRNGADTGDIQIPGGTQIGTSDGSVTFSVIEAVVLKQGQQSIDAKALHCEIVDAELADSGAAQTIRLNKPPVIADSSDGLDVIVGIEAKLEELQDVPSRAFGGKAFAVWKPAASYAEAIATDRTFVIDRVSGLIVLPSLGEGTSIATGAGREIRAWYRRGGGRAGNVGPGTLKVLKTQGLQLNVTNVTAAAGGADAETLQSAIRRTPTETTTMRSAITARDFERAATIGGVARAHAFALAQRWRHADPGIVQILLVPSVEGVALNDGGITADIVATHRSEALRARVAQIIDAKRPLGVGVAVGWTSVRPVGVSARAVITRGEDASVKARQIRTRLNALFSPLNDRLIGRTLRASDAYEAILAEPGVRYADGLRFTVGGTPNANVNDIVRDPHQPRTWFAAANDGLYRSLDDADSWANVFHTANEQPRFVRRHTVRAGLVALGVTRPGGGAIHLSYDCGETWSDAVAAFNCEITDAAWTERDGKPLLFVATRQGLVQFQPGAGTGPAPVVVDQAVDARGYYAVAASISPSGAITVAVSTRETSGVYLSAAGGVSGTFQAIGLKDKDIRSLVVQRFNARDFLWAAAQSEAGQPGDGAFRLELGANGQGGGDWQDFNMGWQGGSCQQLAFVDGVAFAASNRSGVLKLDTTAAAPAWQAMRVDAGLPLRDRDRLLDVVTSIAAAPAQPKPVVFAGGAGGVFKSVDAAEHFVVASATEFADRIPLPPDWVYCAGQHNITVVPEDEG